MNDNIKQAQARIAELEKALRGVLALPVAVKEFDYLDKGIGTETPAGKAWLAARATVAPAVSAQGEAAGLLRRVLDVADSGQWRDRTGLCLYAIPLMDEIHEYLSSPSPAATVAGDVPERYGWKCNCCRTLFTSSQAERTDDGTGNGGAKCPRCKADGQYTYPYRLHDGAPCKHCRTAHDAVAPGECHPAPSGPADARVRALMAKADAELVFWSGHGLTEYGQGVRRAWEEVTAILREVKP